MNYFDTHAHLTSNEVYRNIEELLLRAKNVGIQTIINICTDRETLERGLELRNEFPWIYNVGATTPHDAASEGEKLFSFFEMHARLGNLVAIGETGLDYYYYRDTKEVQKALFIRYLHLALDCSLPVVIHCRDAFDDFFEIIDAEYPSRRGVLHCFTGTIQDAEKLLERGWFLSLSGIVTYKKSDELREVAKFVPLEQLFIETDTPYLAPQTRRGKTNEPAFLVETAELIAKVKGIELGALAKATSENAKMFFAV